jgi:hypothetical protein
VRCAAARQVRLFDTVRLCAQVRTDEPPRISLIGTMWGQYISLPAACVAPRYQTQLTVPRT